MTLRDTLKQTEFRASLAPEYLDGHAPGLQADGRAHQSPEGASYFGMPAIKPPEWKWFVPAYFFVGGTAGGAYIAATLADIVGRREDRNFVRAGHLVALLGLLLSPPLLIADLGRPERFLNMLRVIKPRSVMNTGSWALTVFGIFGGLAAFVDVLRWLGERRAPPRLVGRAMRPLTWLGVLPAWYVGSYTGLLLTSTNVPLWAANYRLLPPLFLSSAMSSGVAASVLTERAFGVGSKATRARLGRAERGIAWTELALTVASLATLRGLARPLVRGRWAWPFGLGSIGLGMLAPLVLPEGWDVLRSVLVLLGALATRFAWTEAGQQSALDPHAYFTYTGTTGAGQTPTRSQPIGPGGNKHGRVPRANLATQGTVIGVVTLAQEDRFRLEDSLGHGYLFTLGRGLGFGLEDLRDWSDRHARIEVDYRGTPDLGAVATGVRESAT